MQTYCKRKCHKLARYSSKLLITRSFIDVYKEKRCTPKTCWEGGGSSLVVKLPSEVGVKNSIPIAVFRNVTLSPLLHFLLDLKPAGPKLEPQRRDKGERWDMQDLGTNTSYGLNMQQAENCPLPKPSVAQNQLGKGPTRGSHEHISTRSESTTTNSPIVQIPIHSNPSSAGTSSTPF